MAKTKFVAAAKKLLGTKGFLTEGESLQNYATDWTKLPGDPWAVALPDSASAVAAFLKLCTLHKIPVVPSGGRTGLAGGAVAQRGQCVLNLSRLNQLFPVDTLGRTVRVQAGVTTQAVHEHCAPSGLTWPIDLASKGSSQIGGNLGTNAGGVRVIRYGMARKWVVGIQAVTMAGEILELNRDLEKNNTGYDLLQLLIGSEGTLAVFTEATLKLARFPSNTQVLLLAFADLDSAFRLYESARQAPFEILAFEFFSERCLKVVGERLGRKSPFKEGAAYLVLMEIDATQGPEIVDKWLQTQTETGELRDGAMARSSREQKEFWGLREGITESIALTGPVKKYDVSVSVRKLPEFLRAVQALYAPDRFGIELYLFGHLGDGSPHLNLLKPEKVPLKKFEKDCATAEKALFELLIKYSGSVSAEHGVGLLKKHWLPKSRSRAEMRLLRAIKTAFDPQGLLNPGKIID